MNKFWTPIAFFFSPLCLKYWCIHIHIAHSIPVWIGFFPFRNIWSTNVRLMWTFFFFLFSLLLCLLSFFRTRSQIGYFRNNYMYFLRISNWIFPNLSNTATQSAYTIDCGSFFTWSSSCLLSLKLIVVYVPEASITISLYIQMKQLWEKAKSNIKKKSILHK